MRRTLVALLLVALAGAGCQEEAVRPTATVQPTDTADQVLFGMEHYITDEGIRRSRVIADTAYLYEGSQIADMRKVHVTFYDRGGVETSTIDADAGIYQMRDGSMKARGHVVATTPDGRRLTSDVLNYDSKKNEISSDQAFTYDGADGHLVGDGFRSDPDFRNVATGKPKARQRPGKPGAPADSGGILLPGQ